MTGKNLVKKIAFGTAVIASLLGGVNAYAQETKNPEVIATFEYTSHRPEKEYNGKTYKYNILSDGTICQADKPNVKFARTWFYDVDGDGEFTAEDLAAHKEGKLIYMHPEFNKIADAESKRILENMVVSLNFDRLHEPEDHTNPFTGASADYNSDGKTDSKKEDSQPSKEIADTIRGYHSQKDLGLEQNTYEPILDEPTLPKEKIKPVWSLIAGANVNSAFDKYELNVGARINPFRNKKIGLGLTADLGFGKDKEIDSYSENITKRLSVAGAVNETNNFSVGASAELQIYNFIFGGGIDYSTWISNTNAQIIKDGTVVKSDSDAESDGKIYWKGHAGLEFQPTKSKNWGIGATIGYHGKDGLTFGIRNTIKLNKRK